MGNPRSEGVACRYGPQAEMIWDQFMCHGRYVDVFISQFINEFVDIDGIVVRSVFIFGRISACTDEIHII